MNKENIKKVIQTLEETGKKIGIEVIMTTGFTGENTTRVYLYVGPEVEDTGTEKETPSNAIRFIELANHLNSKAVFYDIKVKIWGDEIGYGIDLYFVSGGIMYESDITLPSYTNVEEKEVDAREQQLTEIREALEKFLGNADFDLESVVENSLFPYLEKNNVVYLSLFTNLNPIVEGWLEEVMGIKNLADLVPELGRYCISVYENINHDNGDSNAPFMKSSLLHKLVFLVPYMYYDDEKKEQEITEKIKRLDLTVYSKIIEVKMMSSDPKDVKKITKNLLNYRRKLGIRNPKVTKLEIDDYLRVAAYDTMVPRELLRNAVFDVANENKDD